MENNQSPGAAGEPVELAGVEDVGPYVKGERKTLAMFELTGCPYCRAFLPRFLEFCSGHPGEYDFLRVKLDDPGNPLWSKFDIIAVPTVIVFSRGAVVARADAALGLGLSKKKWGEFCASLR